MHELSVTESVLEIACRHAGKAQAKRVTDIYLVIGRLSSIVDDSVQFYWNLISNAKMHNFISDACLQNWCVWTASININWLRN